MSKWARDGHFPLLHFPSKMSFLGGGWLSTCQLLFGGMLPDFFKQYTMTMVTSQTITINWQQFNGQMTNNISWDVNNYHYLGWPWCLNVFLLNPVEKLEAKSSLVSSSNDPPTSTGFFVNSNLKYQISFKRPSKFREFEVCGKILHVTQIHECIHIEYRYHISHVNFIFLSCWLENITKSSTWMFHHFSGVKWTWWCFFPSWKPRTDVVEWSTWSTSEMWVK